MRTLAIITLSLFLFLKPVYVLLFVLIFSLENILFLNLVFKLLKFKKKKLYESFKLESKDICSLSTYESWYAISEINAYVNLYKILSKKKFSFFTIISSLAIVTLGIPVKMIRLFNQILKHKNLKISLNNIYTSNYELYKNNKIEVLEGKVYLNCYNRKGIIKVFKDQNLNISETFVKYKEITEVFKKNMKDIDENNSLKSNISFKLGTLITEEGYKVKRNHYTSIQNFKFQRDGEYYYKCALHATSNMPSALTDTQLRGAAMYTLMMNNSKNPGNVFTHGNFTFKEVETTEKLVPKWQVLQSIVSIECIEPKDINRLKQNELAIINKWEKRYEEIIGDYKNKHIIDELTRGYFNTTLFHDATCNNDDLYKLIRDDFSK